MSLVKRAQRQSLVYWAPKIASSHGATRYYEPVILACRWDGKVQQIITETGESKISKVELITEKLLEVGGVVFLGSQADLKYPHTPMKNIGAYEVLKVAFTPPLRTGDTLYEAWA